MPRKKAAAAESSPAGPIGSPGSPRLRELRSPADYLNVISRAVYTSGLTWKSMDERWDRYERAFHGFDPVWIAGLDDAHQSVLLESGEIMRSRQKLTATIANAKAVLEVAREKGDLAHYFASFGEDAEALASDLRRRFKFMGTFNAYYVAFVCGGPVEEFETWSQRVHEDHPRMRELVAEAEATGRRSFKKRKSRAKPPM